MTIDSPSARFSASLRSVMGRCSRGGEDTDGSFRVGAPALRGRRLDVVDQTGGADGRGDGGEGALARLRDRVRVDGGEVLRLAPVLARDRLAGLQAAARRGVQGSAEGERLGAL